MIEVTTATLGAKLNKALGLNLKRINICPGDYLLAKLQEKELLDQLPAIALEHNNIQVSRESIPRTIVGRRGMIINRDTSSGKLDLLKMLPIMLSYSVTILVSNNTQRNKVETDLLWFLEDANDKILNIPLVVEGTEVTLPAEIATSSYGVSLSLNRKDSWEDYKGYRVDLDLEVKSFLVKYESKPIITKVNYEIRNGELILAEG